MGERGGLNVYVFLNNCSIDTLDLYGLLTFRILEPSISYVNWRHLKGGDYTANASLACICKPHDSRLQRMECVLTAAPHIRLNKNEEIRRAVRALSRHPNITTEQHEYNHHRVFKSTYVGSFTDLVAQYEGKECCNCGERLRELLRQFNNLSRSLVAWEHVMEEGRIPEDGSITGDGFIEGGWDPWIDYGRNQRPVPIPEAEPECK